MTSNTFKYTATRALPASYSVGGKTYIFKAGTKVKPSPVPYNQHYANIQYNF